MFEILFIVLWCVISAIIAYSMEKKENIYMFGFMSATLLQLILR